MNSDVENLTAQGPRKLISGQGEKEELFYPVPVLNSKKKNSGETSHTLRQQLVNNHHEIFILET